MQDHTNIKFNKLVLGTREFLNLTKCYKYLIWYSSRQISLVVNACWIVIHIAPTIVTCSVLQYTQPCVSNDAQKLNLTKQTVRYCCRHEMSVEQSESADVKNTHAQSWFCTSVGGQVIWCSKTNKETKRHSLINIIMNYIVSGTAVAHWLRCCAALVRFQMVSLEFFINIILPIALWPWGRLSL